MKKLLSVLLVVVMLASICTVAAFSSSALEAPATKHTVTYNNVKKGDILQYSYYLQCDKVIMNSQCETTYSDNLKPVEVLDEYGDPDLSSMLPSLVGSIAFNIDSTPIHFNFSHINGIKFYEKGCMMNLYFIVTKDGDASVTSNMKIMQAKDETLLVFDYKAQPGAEFEYTNSLTKPANAPEVKLIGDVDSSGSIDINDASYVQKHSASISLPKFDKDVADVDMNGSIDINDASYLQKYAASIELPKTIIVGKYVTFAE